MNKAWWKEAVVYQIYPRSFMDANGDGIGDLKGITEKLPYLKELGIDVIWLSPVYESPNDDNGYDISDYKQIMRAFGTMSDFDEMLQTAHDLGIKIMMDLVVNHTSDEHNWFVESRKSKDNPYRDYYFWREGKKDGSAPNNWGSIFGGSAWQYDENTDMYYLHLFSKKQPDLNWDHPEVRAHIFEMMDWWCQKGIDGFRMDVISLISKVKGLPDGEAEGDCYADCTPYCANGPHVHTYLKEMNKQVLSRYDLITVGEAAGVTLEEAKQYAGENTQELNMVFQFEHVGEGPERKSQYGKWDAEPMPLPKLKAILEKWQKGLEGIAWNSLYWCNHDQPRSVSRYGNDSPKYRAVSAKMLATCLHMMQGTPYIYQGEELGMTNAYFNQLEDYRDIESLNAYKELTEKHGLPSEQVMQYLQKIGRDNARTPMQWNDQEQAGFTTGIPWIKVNANYKEINAAQQLADPDSVYHYYKKLIALRHHMPIIVYGTFELLAAEDENLFVFTRQLEKEKLLVVCNFTAQDQIKPQWLMDQQLSSATILISNYVAQLPQLLRPYEAIVYHLDNEA